MCWRKECSPYDQKCQDSGREVFESVQSFKALNTIYSSHTIIQTVVLIYFVACDNHRVVQPRVHRELQCHEQLRVHHGWCRTRIHLADVLIETLQLIFSTRSVHKRVSRWQPLRASCLVETVPRPTSTSTFPQLVTSTSLPWRCQVDTLQTCE